MNQQGNDGLRDELTKLDGQFSATPALEMRKEVPDGRYAGEVELVELKRARSQAPMLEWRIRIDEGDYRGEAVWYRRTITERSLKYVKQDFEVAGLHVERISTVAEHLPRLKGVRLAFTIRTKHERRNVYLNHRLDGGDDDARANVIEAAEEDFPV